MVRSRGRRSIWSWLTRGTWQPFELVLLDHGTYLDIPDRIRVAYAQLWCALFAGDQVGGGNGGQKVTGRVYAKGEGGLCREAASW